MFCGWQDGGWLDLTLYQTMSTDGVSPQDTGSTMLQCAMAYQRLGLGTPPAPGVVSSENTASVRVRRFESAAQARHFLVATAANNANWSNGGYGGFVYLANLHADLGDVNITKRLCPLENPGLASIDETIHFARANVVVSVTSNWSGITPPATTAELAAAIDTHLDCVQLVSPYQVDSARPSIALTFSKPYLMAAGDLREKGIPYLLRSNYCGIELDVGTVNNNPFIYQTGQTEASIMTRPVPGGTPGLLRSAYQGGSYPVGVAVLDTEAMIPGVLIAWIDCYQR
jgi:hypothetical protein